MIFKIALSTFLFANLTLVIIDEVLNGADDKVLDDTDNQCCIAGYSEAEFCNCSIGYTLRLSI